MQTVLSPARRRQLLLALGAIALYLSSIWFFAWFIENHPNSGWSALAAAIPIATIAIAVVVSMSSIRGMDELQVRMHLEALAFAYLSTLFLSFGYAFVAAAGVIKTVGLQLITPIMVVLWTIGMLIALWRYR